MTKEDMVQVLRSVGVNENTVTAMINAFDMGVEHEREMCAKVCDDIDVEYEGDHVLATWCSRAIRARGEA